MCHFNSEKMKRVSVLVKWPQSVDHIVWLLAKKLHPFDPNRPVGRIQKVERPCHLMSSVYLEFKEEEHFYCR